MAGSILAGWAVAPGRYRPRRWVRASFWALTPTAAGPADGPGRCWRSGGGQGAEGGGQSSRGSSRGREHKEVAVGAGVNGRGGSPLAGAGGVAGGGGDLTAGDGGVQGDDVLGVDEPGGAGPADPPPRGIPPAPPPAPAPGAGRG